MESIYEEANPIMGTVANEVEGAGGGKTYPGAVLPFGMVQLSPDTVTGGDNGAGYSYGHKTIEGFSFVHMSGIGWYGDFGNIQVMPMTGERRYHSGTNEYNHIPIGEDGWESHFDHAGEIARPGYYAVTLTDYGIRTEATVTRHTGALRFTFAQKSAAHIAVDLYRRIGGHATLESIVIRDSRHFSGKILCTPEGGGWGHGAGQVGYEIFFVSEFSKEMKSWALFENGNIHENETSMESNALGLIADFDVEAGERIGLHTAISFVDAFGAENNFAAEDLPFDVMLDRARKEWENALSLIRITGGSKDDREIFYSSLYHTLLDPRDFSDADGRYRADRREPKKIRDFVFRTIFSGWDVYRSAFPLFTLIRPDVVNDEINTQLEISMMNDEAMFARWEIVGRESCCMVGDPAANVLADAYVKGIRDYDAEKAYAICRRWYLGDRKYTGQLAEFNEKGYFTGDISRTLEYSLTCYSLSRMAEALGHHDDAKEFAEKAQNYRNVFDPDAGWMNRRDGNGNFEPFKDKYDERGCVESNIYQQTWFVPQDIGGLYDLMGHERFEKELDEFFEKADLSAFWNDNYNHSNEPVHTIPQIYVHIGRPEKSQYWIRRIRKEAYRTGAYGYCGNEDVGQLSAWYVMTALGLHESTIGSGIFELNTPLFEKAELRLDRKYHGCENGETLTILTDKDPELHPYIAGIELNGAKLDRCYLTWEELSSGGTVRFFLSASPTGFGKDNPPKIR